MGYRVIKYFTDLQDNNREYHAGDIYPRNGLKVTKARIEELGVEDLTDPVQNTIVTVDLLSELFEKYGDDVPYVLMCYNAGEGNAKRMARKGITETAYTRKVMREQERIENAKQQQCDDS